MSATDDSRPSTGWKWIVTPRAWITLWLPVLLITYLHYSTAPGHGWMHDVFRRLYYIPIILGAFQYGLKGALAASAFASVLYLPHAFTDFLVRDPAGTIEKLLEILLYNIVGFITGYLAQKERSERIRQEAAAQKLSEALEKKKLLEKQLIRAGKLKALGELTAGIAHEIKNPLASIKGAAEAIADEIPESSPRRKLVEIQSRELDRLTQTLDRFLSFARHGGGLVAAPVDLIRLCRHVRDLVGAQARKNNVEIVVEDQGLGLWAKGDKDQLTQVLVNLVLNACDAMPEGGRVRLSARKDELGGVSYSVIDVTDSGPGIPDHIRDKVFDPFFSTKEGGTGLGLSISSNIVDWHGGFIRLGKPDGEPGTIVSVYLPQEQVRSD